MVNNLKKRDSGFTKRIFNNPKWKIPTRIFLGITTLSKLIGLFLLGSRITGHAISDFSLNETAFLGAGFFVFGLIGLLIYINIFHNPKSIK